MSSSRKPIRKRWHEYAEHSREELGWSGAAHIPMDGFWDQYQPFDALEAYIVRYVRERWAPATSVFDVIDLIYDLFTDDREQLMRLRQEARNSIEETP